jgi:hypothetical protein
MVDLVPTLEWSHGKRETSPWRTLFFVVYFGLRDDLLTTVKTVGRYTVPQVRLSGGRIDGQRGILQFVMRTPHAAA